jgi:hypothetical protein
VQRVQVSGTMDPQQAGRKLPGNVIFADKAGGAGVAFRYAGEWSFPDGPLRGVFGRNDVYAGITGWESFEPWLSPIEGFSENSLWSLVDQIPPEYDSAPDELEQLLSRLLERRTRVCDLLVSFKNSSRNPFPKWSRPSA